MKEMSMKREDQDEEKIVEITETTKKLKSMKSLKGGGEGIPEIITTEVLMISLDTKKGHIIARSIPMLCVKIIGADIRTIIQDQENTVTTSQNPLHIMKLVQILEQWSRRTSYARSLGRMMIMK